MGPFAVVTKRWGEGVYTHHEREALRRGRYKTYDCRWRHYRILRLIVGSMGASMTLSARDALTNLPYFEKQCSYFSSLKYKRASNAHQLSR